MCVLDLLETNSLNSLHLISMFVLYSNKEPWTNFSPYSPFLPPYLFHPTPSCNHHTVVHVHEFFLFFIFLLVQINGITPLISYYCNVCHAVKSILYNINILSSLLFLIKRILILPSFFGLGIFFFFSITAKREKYLNLLQFPEWFSLIQ